jgi:hypothetical protein
MDTLSSLTANFNIETAHKVGPQKIELGALSEEEQRMRTPLPPEVLANPLPDIGYRQTGRSRPAKAARSHKNSLR